MARQEGMSGGEPYAGLTLLRAPGVRRIVPRPESSERPLLSIDSMSRKKQEK